MVVLSLRQFKCDICNIVFINTFWTTLNTFMLKDKFNFNKVLLERVNEKAFIQHLISEWLHLQTLFLLWFCSRFRNQAAETLKTLKYQSRDIETSQDCMRRRHMKWAGDTFWRNLNLANEPHNYSMQITHHCKLREILTLRHLIPVRFHGLICVCAQPMRDDVTI